MAGYRTLTNLPGLPLNVHSRKILVGFLGAQRTRTKPTSVIGGQHQAHGHLPRLWEEVALVVAGRAAATAFGSMIGVPNPFGSWSVDDRYEDGATITQQAVADHLEISRQVLGHLETAKVLGVLP